MIEIKFNGKSTDGNSQVVNFVLYNGSWQVEYDEVTGQDERAFKRTSIERTGSLIRDVLPEDDNQLIAMIKFICIEEYGYSENEFIQ